MSPDKFNWLNDIGTLPKLVTAAQQYIGVKEIPGAKSNPVILDMARGLGIGDIYTNDDTSWCALFINHLLRITGKPIPSYNKDRYNLLRAKWLKNYGNEVPKEEVKLGDVVVIDREGGGHVFLFIAKTDKGTWIGLGGNQGNQVSYSEFDPKRVEAVRRYYATGIPASAQLYTVQSDGKLSTNEA